MARLDLQTVVTVKGAEKLKQMSNDLQATSTSLTKTQKALAFGGGLLGATLIAPKVLDFLGDAAAGARDLEEAQNKVNVVFGESAEITKWAEDAADSFGTSKRAALEAVGTYGNLFRAFGIGQGKAEEMSTSLVELAADMASFNNTSVDDALEALRSGLSGETEPLKRFGVALTDARLKEIALREGIYDGVGALDAAAKAQAAYTLILEDTALAQGDYARTSDGLANSQKRIDAAITNTTDELGKLVASIQLGGIRVAEFLADAWEGAPAEAEKAAQETAQKWKDASEMDMPKSVARGVELMALEAKKGGPVIAAEWSRTEALVQLELDKIVDSAKQAGIDGILEFGSSVLNNRQSAVDQVAEMVRLLDEALSPIETIAGLTGEATVTELKEGLRSDDEGMRLAAGATISFIIAELNKLGPAGFAAGVELMRQLGYGIDSGKESAKQAAQDAGRDVRYQFPFSEPKDPNSPLRGLKQAGANIIGMVAEGMKSAKPLSLGLSGLAGLPVGSQGMPGAGMHQTVVNVQYSGEQPSNDSEFLAMLRQLAPFIDGRLRLAE